MAQPPWHKTIQNGLAAMADPEDPFWGAVMTHGSLEIGLYAPKGTDAQTPHDQDEVYIIASGRGTFFNDGEQSDFQTGDVLFVPAGAEHHFEKFSEDFQAWVIFYGPKGGERP